MTKETTSGIAHAAHDLYGVARNIITEALYAEEDAMEVAKLLREQIRAAWAKALEDSGMPEEYARKLRFPL